MSYRDNEIHGSFAETSFDIVLAGKTDTSNWWLDENGSNWWNGKYTYDFDIIYYVLQGQLQLKIEGIWYTISEGQLVYIPAGKQLECRIAGQSPVEKYYLHFTVSLRHLPVLTSYTSANIVSVGNSPYLKQHFNTICQGDDSTYTSIIQSHASGLAIIYEFLEKATIEYAPDTMHIDDAIGKAMQYITTHFRESLSVENLATQAGLSRDHFSRKFTSRYGCSPVRYITKLKIREAEALLVTTNQSISEIAEAVGFSDSSYFSRLFKKATGIYPQRFRMLSKSTTANTYLPSSKNNLSDL